MRRSLLALATLLSIGAAQADVIDIDNAELARLQAAGVPVVDIRTAPEWQETGIVPGSHLLTFFGERGQAEPVPWLHKLQAIATPEQPVILICRSGNRTRSVSTFLSDKIGYTTVYNVKQGIRAWIKAGQPVDGAVKAASTCAWATSC